MLLSMICCSYLAEAQPQLTFSPLISNLTKPVEISNAGDGSGRLFIVEQTGRIKIYKNGAIQSKPFLDLSNVVSTGQYKGLWSIAFAPNYKKNRMCFVYYVDKSQNTILARYQVSKTNPDSIIANSAVVLLSLSGLNSGGPHLGQLHFGRDGYLYVTVNDGSYLDQTTNLSQNGQVLFGKILRLNINSNTPPYYTIPPDNPFVNDPNVLDEIWALGLRNMWRWSFDRRNGNMWLGDDGGKQWDEIDFRARNQPSGANFGWPCYEGFQSFITTGCKDSGSYTFPILTNPPDSVAGGQAIIGGYVYSGSNYPALSGYYICSDYVSNKAWKIISNGSGGWNIYEQTGIPALIAGYGEDENGELYAASLDGTIYNVGATTSLLNYSLQSNQSVQSNIGAAIYPTLVDNHTIILDLNESYNTLRLFDMAGHEIMMKKLSGNKGKTSISLPALNAGFYVVQLAGKHNFQQKIYITR